MSKPRPEAAETDLEQGSRPTTSNSFIERQRAYLASLGGSQPDAGAAQPTTADEAGEEKKDVSLPENPDQSEAPAAPQAPVSQAPTGDDIHTLKDQIKKLENDLSAALGRVTPTQRELAEARNQINELTTLLNELKTAPKPPASPQDLESDEDFKSFVDIYGDMIPGLEKFIQKSLAQHVEPKLKKLDPILKQADSQTEQDALKEKRSKHLVPVFDKYPKAGAIIQSPEFRDFVGSMASYIQSTVLDMLEYPENYPQEKIINLLDDFHSRRQSAPAPQAQTPDPGLMSTEPRRIPSSPKNVSAGPVPLTKVRLAEINRELTINRRNHSLEEINALMRELHEGEVAAISEGRGAIPTLQTLK
jgi:hypothetical protein